MFINISWKDAKSKISLARISHYKKVGWNWLDEIKIRRSHPGKINSCNFFNSKLYFKNSSDVLHSVNEIFIEDIYKVALPEHPVIFDCGANIGLSILYFKRQFPNATVVAFEPDSQNFEILSRNIKSYNLQNVELHNEAIWIENTYLNFSNDNSLSSRIKEPGENVNNSIKVKAARLFDLLTQPVDFLKVDIEGAEYQVLKDIEPKLHLVQHLFFEYHGNFNQNNELSDIFSILSRNNFHYYIREASTTYQTPFYRNEKNMYDVQLNIFCFKQ
jgi:FkbM family methyltransferase